MSKALRGSAEEFKQIIRGLEYDENLQKLSLSGTPGLITTVLTMNTLMDACIEIVGEKKTSEILYRHGYLLCSRFVRPLRSS